MTTPPPPPPPEFSRLPLPPGFSEDSPADAPPPPPPAAPQAAPGYAQAPSAQPSHGYAQPPGQQPAPGYPHAAGWQGASPVATPKTWMNVLSFISGVMCFFGVTAVAAVILGHLGVAAAKRGEAKSRGLGVAGLILGYLWIVFAIFALLGRLTY